MGSRVCIHGRMGSTMQAMGHEAPGIYGRSEGRKGRSGDQETDPRLRPNSRPYDPTREQVIKWLVAEHEGSCSLQQAPNWDQCCTPYTNEPC
jgi:hypothetical protein